MPVIATDVETAAGLFTEEMTNRLSEFLPSITNVEEITRAILRFASDSRMRNRRIW